MINSPALHTFGAQVRSRREHLGLTRAQLAHTVGCAVVTLRKIESGERRPSRQLADLLVRHLQLPLKDVEPPAAPVATSRKPAPKLIGRTQDIEYAASRLLQSDIQLLTLIGPGGVGKTSLGHAIVSRTGSVFADGAVVVELAPLAGAQRVPDAVLQALGQTPDGGIAPQDALIAYLQARHMLLLLDNFEHVTDAAPWLAQLLTACPGVKALVTSRHALGTPNEVLFVVQPLQLPASADLVLVEAASAVQLFVQRARAVDAQFQLSDKNAAAIAEICQRLDGLPLAIELVAARAKLMSPPALLARLVDAAGHTQLDRVADAAHATDSRHKRLRDTLDWSHALLNPFERAAFRQLSIFKGGWTLEAAEAVCDFQDDDTSSDEMVNCWDALASLLDKSLIQQRRVEDEEEPRFTLLETVREYAAEKLVEAGEFHRVYGRHARYFCEWAEAIEPVLVDGTQQGLWLARLEREHDNFRAALQWTLNTSALSELDVSDAASSDEALTGSRLAAALTRFWWIRTHWSEGRAWLERALALFADETAQVLSRSPSELSMVHSRVLRGAGLLAFSQTELPQGRLYTEQALALARPLGDKIWTGIVLGNLATIVMMQGDFALGKALTEEGLALDREMNNVRGIAFGVGTLGELAFSQGDYPLAIQYWTETIEMYRARGDENSVALTLVNLSAALTYIQQYDEAVTHCEKGLALGRQLGNPHIETIALQNLAEIYAELGNAAAAKTHYVAALRIASELQSATQYCALLSDIGTQMALQGHWERAALLYGAAVGLRGASGLVMHAHERDMREKTIIELRQHLGDAAYERAYAIGAALSLNEAMASAAEI